MTKAPRMTRARWIALAVVAALALLLGVNALVVSAETKPAHADIGQLVTLRGGDRLQVRQDGPATALLPFAARVLHG